MIELPPKSLCFWFIYIMITAFGSLFVRVINSMWRNLESDKPSWTRFKALFKGCGWIERREQNDVNTGRATRVQRTGADHLQAFFLGWLELISYPVLLFSEKPSFIGAWLAFKTIHRWNYALGINRGFYNRYLLSNALILIESYALAKLMLVT